MLAYKYPLCSTTVLALLMLCGTIDYAYALPEGGVVRGGSAVMVTSGNALDVTQGSDKAIIDWRGFDIGSGEKTEFHQPRASSVAINRVTSTSTSQIDGSLKANGNVVIINQNGIAFGKGAKVDVNSLIATTADASNDTLMRERKLTFDIPGNPDAGIVNEGTITAKDAGLVGLVAPNVMNAGTITAKLGRVQLASGDTATVDFYGDGLMKIAVSDKVTSQLVANTGEIKADGGTIALTAAAGAKMVNSLIDAEGHLQAQSVAEKNGEIIISAEGSNAVAGNVAADKGRKTGTSTVLVQGILDASGRKKGERGGKVGVFGDNIALAGGTVIDVSGDSGKSNTTAKGKISDTRKGAAGGDVKIGGDYLGSGNSPTAKNLYVDANTYVVNDSLTKGDAGRTIFWSDGRTQFNGNVFARALGGQPIDVKTGDAKSSPSGRGKGEGSGNGGFVETSGHEQLDAGGYVNLTASDGERGTYFLDPANIAIYGYVDPAFQSTDGSINLAGNLKLWLDASDTSKVNLTYSTDALSGATVTGVSGASTVTTSVDVSGSLAVGARIRLGGAGAVTAANTVGSDTYTIAGIAGTTISLSAPLTTNYNGGAGNNTLYRGLVSQLTDKTGQGHTATQAAVSNMPLWINNGQNGLGIERFDGVNDGQFVAGYNPSGGITVFSSFANQRPAITTVDILYATGNFGGGNNGFALATSNSFVSTTQRRLYQDNNSSTTYLYKNGDNSTTNLNLGEFAIAAHSYNAATIGNQFALSTFANGGYFGKNDIGEIYLYNAALSANPRNLVEQYQSLKWGIPLIPPGSGATEAAQATASIQKGDAADGYSVFGTRYLEHLSQSANIALQASNNITLDLKGDNLNFTTAGRSLSLTAGNQITTASTGSITTNNGAISLTGNNGILFNHAFSLNSGNAATTLNSSAGSIKLPTITAGSILAQAGAATSDITIPVGQTLTASNAGNAITLAATRNFINNTGAGALSNSSGRWLIYSTNPTATTGEDLLSPASSFNRYNCTYALCNGGVTIPVTGNGLIYSFVPTLTVTGITASKIVDGNRIAPITSGTITGALAGDTGITLDGSAVTGIFADSSIGNAKPVTLAGLYALGGTNYGYQLIQPAGITGAITPPLPSSTPVSPPSVTPTAPVIPVAALPTPVAPPSLPLPGDSDASPPAAPVFIPPSPSPFQPVNSTLSSSLTLPNTLQIGLLGGSLNAIPVMPLLSASSSPPLSPLEATNALTSVGNASEEEHAPEQMSENAVTPTPKPPASSFRSLLQGLIHVHPVIQKRFGLDQNL